MVLDTPYEVCSCSLDLKSNLAQKAVRASPMFSTNTRHSAMVGHVQLHH